MQSVTKFLTPHLQELMRTAARRNMTPPFDLHLTGSNCDHFQCQIDEQGQIVPREDVSPGAESSAGVPAAQDHTGR
jgi:hypothetical protein